MKLHEVESEQAPEPSAEPTESPIEHDWADGIRDAEHYLRHHGHDPLHKNIARCLLAADHHLATERRLYRRTKSNLEELRKSSDRQIGRAEARVRDAEADAEVSRADEREWFRMWQETNAELEALREAAGDVLLAWRDEDPMHDHVMDEAVERLAKVLAP